MAWIQPARAAHLLKRRWRRRQRKEAWLCSDGLSGSLVPRPGRGRLCWRGCVQVRGAGLGWWWGPWVTWAGKRVTALSVPRLQLWPLLCGAGGPLVQRRQLEGPGTCLLVVPRGGGCGLPLVSSPPPQARGSPLLPRRARGPGSQCWQPGLRGVRRHLCPLPRSCLGGLEAMPAPGQRLQCPKGRAAQGAARVQGRLPQPLGQRRLRGWPVAPPRARRRPLGLPWP